MPEINTPEIKRDLIANWKFFSGLFVIICGIWLVREGDGQVVDYLLNIAIVLSLSVFGIFLRYVARGWISFGAN